LDRVSLVPSGDDPLAQVLLVKAAPEMSTTFEESDRKVFDQSGGSRMPPRRYVESEDAEITKDDLPQEVVEYIEALEDALDASVDRVQKVEEELTKAKKKAPADEEEANESEEEEAKEDAVGKADPVLRQEIEKMRSDHAEAIKKANERAEAAEELAKSERTQRLTREFVAKAADLPMIAEDPNELGSLLMELDALDPAAADKVEKLFKAANEGLRQGDLFGEIGRHGGAVTSSPAIDAAAEAIRKDAPELTQEQAVAKAYEDNPDLYDEEIREARMNGR
jgi:hypothetical protein